MDYQISPENEQFVQQAVDNGKFRDGSEAMNEAVRLLKVRTELLEHVDLGTRQLQDGQYSEFDEASLREYFDELQRRGRARHNACGQNH